MYRLKRTSWEEKTTARLSHTSEQTWPTHFIFSALFTPIASCQFTPPDSGIVSISWYHRCELYTGLKYTGSSIYMTTWPEWLKLSHTSCLMGQQIIKKKNLTPYIIRYNVADGWIIWDVRSWASVDYWSFVIWLQININTAWRVWQLCTDVTWFSGPGKAGYNRGLVMSKTIWFTHTLTEGL